MRLTLPAILASFVLLAPVRAMGAPPGHCAPAVVTPVPSDPGAYRIVTPRATTVARCYPSPVVPATAAVTAVIRVWPNSFDADGDTLGTLHDTILVAPGTLVRFVRAGPGFHTVTNGRDSGDLNAASEYNAIFDDTTQSFERVFTRIGLNDYFCFIHEPSMMGSIFVTSETAGVNPGVISTPRFSRSPSPNPARGDVGFAIALPRSTHVTLAVHDVSGRRVAELQNGPLSAGEHGFRWNARGGDGRLVQSGRYFIRFAAGAVRESKAVSLIR